MNHFEKSFKKLEEVIIPDDNPWPIRLAMFIFALIIGVCITTAQIPVKPFTPGLGMDLIAAANGHGNFYSPNVSIGIGDNRIILGGLLKTTSNEFSGMRLTYSRNLSSSVYDEWMPEERGYDIVQLNFYSYIQYVQNCGISEQVMRHEQLKRRDHALDLSDVRFNTGQAGAGIEFRINLSKSLCIRNGVALSVYHHFYNQQLLFHEQTAARLTLFTGLHFVIL